MEAIVTLQFNGTDVTVGKLFTSIRRGIESAHFTYDTAYMRSSNAVSLCPEMSPRNVPGRAQCDASHLSRLHVGSLGQEPHASRRTSRCSFGASHSTYTI